MDYVKLRTHVVDHVRFLEVGPQARDLWHWGMLYAGRHETDGELPMAAVMASSWGRGGRANVMVAARLVEAGLWERTESGWRVLRWEEQGNLTRSQISSAREAARERMKKRRSPNPDGVCSREQPANFARSSLGVPTSTSTSTSTSTYESGSDPRSKSSQVGSAEPATSVTSTPPEWWGAVCDTVEAGTGAKIERAAAWLRYSGHRATNGKRMAAPDAQYWLTTVDVREQAADRRREQTQRDLAQQRREGPPKAPAPTPEQSKRFAEELSRRLLGQRNAGGER